MKLKQVHLKLICFLLVQLHDVSSFCYVFALTFFQTSSNISLVSYLKETAKVTNSKVCFYISLFWASSNPDQVGYFTKPNPKYVFTFDNLQITSNIIILQLYCNLMCNNVVYIYSKLN
jgi:hypothetical protein